MPDFSKLLTYSFWHDPLTLVLIDKAVLALVLVAAGLLANRKLEAFKARAALRAKMSEGVLDKLSVHIAALAAVERSVSGFLNITYFNATNRIPTEVARQHRADSPEYEAALRAAFGDAFAEDHEAFDALHTQILKAHVAAEADRFWLGRARTSGILSELNKQRLRASLVERSFQECHKQWFDEIAGWLRPPTRTERAKAYLLKQLHRRKRRPLHEVDIDEMLEDLASR